MLTFNLAQKYFTYNSITGIMRWKIQKGPKKAGSHVGSNNKGHTFVCFEYKRYPITHIIWLLKTGKFPNCSVDHRNRVRNDNRWSNLRAATSKDQQGNQPLYKNNTSGKRGVSYRSSRGTWRARLHTGGKEVYLGTFRTKKEAHKLYKEAAKKYFGEFYSGV